MAIETLVWAVLYMLIAGAVIGILWGLINYFERNFPGSPMPFKYVRMAFVVLLALFVIGILLSLLGVPIIQLPGRRVP